MVSYPRLALAASLAPILVAGCAQPQPPNPPPLATQPTVGQEVSAVVNNKLQVTFPTGGTRLTAEAQAQLDVAARLFRVVNAFEMFSIC